MNDCSCVILLISRRAKDGEEGRQSSKEDNLWLNVALQRMVEVLQPPLLSEGGRLTSTEFEVPIQRTKLFHLLNSEMLSENQTKTHIILKWSCFVVVVFLLLFLFSHFKMKGVN